MAERVSSPEGYDAQSELESLFAPDDERGEATVGAEQDLWNAAVRSPHQDVMLVLPEDAEGRKEVPIATGVLDYFPAAIAEVARVSKAGNDQHNPGQPLHWARDKSLDHADCVARHLIQRGTLDSDGVRHTAKVAWRALALLQEELEAEAGFVPEVRG
jgi:hypothetical protein